MTNITQIINTIYHHKHGKGFCQSKHIGIIRQRHVRPTKHGSDKAEAYRVLWQDVSLLFYYRIINKKNIKVNRTTKASRCGYILTNAYSDNKMKSQSGQIRSLYWGIFLPDRHRFNSVHSPGNIQIEESLNWTISTSTTIAIFDITATDIMTSTANIQAMILQGSRTSQVHGYYEYDTHDCRRNNWCQSFEPYPSKMDLLSSPPKKNWLPA